ncbi:biotin--[acetyl-CoA-carboxylase] ligase [Clostridium aminobutyricum]|uniref:Bifunctional ligase/repressor BirA n=1 Tax=Clostridium aminobutyricum TaxID=33953 RepID=A0A939IJR4_CLOAM|nr:biotin--[acetyl-CoA-carboxylase] ligase [Clostridium aminobutyricum]MBN7774371.1 biotin--[acetyl-CoA-carboxylase] ligase [Clostridium aminobutyricum]
MSVKGEVLKALEQNKGQSFSGESLALTLGVSRAAVWKAITALRKEGYPIEAITNKGYMLLEESDLLSEQGVRMHLRPNNSSMPLYVHSIIDSTNQGAKLLALQGAEHGTVVLANEQTKGRGRLGRDFYSPASTGIYLSIILKPNFDSSKSVLVTTAASVAVVRAIKKVCQCDAVIKWVNDVYIGEKKICGILTEAVSNFENGEIEYLVLGIGVNCQLPANGFPEEIKEKAGVIPVPFSRNMLAAEIINQVLEIYAELESRNFIQEYKQKSMVLGKNIQVIRKGVSLEAFARDIDEDGGLLVEFPDGTKEVLNTGEISIRF